MGPPTCYKCRTEPEFCSNPQLHCVRCTAVPMDWHITALHVLFVQCCKHFSCTYLLEQQALQQQTDRQVCWFCGRLEGTGNLSKITFCPSSSVLLVPASFKLKNAKKRHILNHLAQRCLYHPRDFLYSRETSINLDNWQRENTTWELGDLFWLSLICLWHPPDTLDEGSL